MTSTGRRWGIAVFVWLLLTITVRQVKEGFDLAELALNVVLAAIMGWLVAWSADRYHRRQRQ